VIRQNEKGESVEGYDFSNIGPFFGTEIKLLQPLNIDRLLNGLKAASYNVNVSECDVRKARVEMSRTLQELYFKYIYTRQMTSLAQEVKTNLQKAIDKVNAALDEDDDERVSQADLLELKTQQFTIDDGLYQARYGQDVAHNAMVFCLQSDTFRIQDTVLYLRTDKIPGIDSLKVLMIANHPDLARLALGMKAQEMMVKVARGELLPDAFVAGSYKFTRAWSDKVHENSTEDLLNPYNKKEATLGLGLRFNLNMWSLKDKYIKEKCELEQLHYKETYASDGLFMDLENQYQKVNHYYKRQEAAAISLEAADSWLKSAAMKYDIDPSQVSGLLKAYEKNIQAKKDFYDCVLDYNIAVADLIAKTGLTLSDFHR